MCRAIINDDKLTIIGIVIQGRFEDESVIPWRRYHFE